MSNWPLAKLYIRRLELTVDEAREDLAGLRADCDELKAAALRTAAEKARLIAYRAGICVECGKEIRHESEEPFAYCGCGCTEDTEGPGLIQRLRARHAEAVALLRESIDRILFVEQGAMDLRGRISAHLAACDQETKR